MKNSDILELMSLLWLFITVGGIIGGYAPSIFGGGDLSVWSVLGGLIGSILGIVVYKKLDL